jgi:hypothetical protein
MTFTRKVPMTSKEPLRSKVKPRCETCKGTFGLIRHRFAHKQFCSKQCLDEYLAKGTQRSHFKQWIDFSRG